MNEKVQNIEKSTDLLESEFAICCDIEQDLYLVPKQWVQEYVLEQFADYAYALTKQVLSHLKDASKLYMV